MTSKGSVVVKQFPQSRNFARRKSFLADVRDLARRTYRPQLVLEISESAEMAPDAIELLLECVEQVERADGRVSVVAGSPQTAVILELTRLTSVLDIFSSVSEAVNGGTLHRFEHDGLVQPAVA
jgi:anti-anti-sigma regulatory factor